MQEAAPGGGASEQLDAKPRHRAEARSCGTTLLRARASLSRKSSEPISNTKPTPRPKAHGLAARGQAVEALAQGLLEREVLQRHDLVKILGDRRFKYEGQQNIDILNEGYRMPELKTTAEDDAKEDVAAEGGANGGTGGDSKKVDEVPAGAIPVAS